MAVLNRQIENLASEGRMKTGRRTVVLGHWDEWRSSGVVGIAKPLVRHGAINVLTGSIVPYFQAPVEFCHPTTALTWRRD